MDLQDRIADISICSSIVEEIADDSPLEVHEIAVGGLEVSDIQRPR